MYIRFIALHVNYNTKYKMNNSKFKSNLSPTHSLSLSHSVSVSLLSIAGTPSGFSYLFINYYRVFIALNTIISATPHAVDAKPTTRPIR